MAILLDLYRQPTLRRCLSANLELPGYLRVHRKSNLPSIYLFAFRRSVPACAYNRFNARCVLSRLRFRLLCFFGNAVRQLSHEGPNLFNIRVDKFSKIHMSLLSCGSVVSEIFDKWVNISPPGENSPLYLAAELGSMGSRRAAGGGALCPSRWERGLHPSRHGRLPLRSRRPACAAQPTARDGSAATGGTRTQRAAPSASIV